MSEQSGPPPAGFYDDPATEAPYDPASNLTQLRGKGGPQDYLEVKYRLKWLRDQYPDAALDTLHVELSAERAVFVCKVKLPSGAASSGYGSETPNDFADYIEKAETKAIGRALAALGFGTQFVGSELEGKNGPRIVDAPVNRATAPNAPQAHQEATQRANVGQTTNHTNQGANGAPRPTGNAYGAPSTTQRATDRQLGFLKTIAREKGLTEEALNAELSKLYGVSSVAELSRANASALIDRLQSRNAGDFN